MSAPIDKHTGEFGGARAYWDTPFPWSAAYPPNPDWLLPPSPAASPFIAGELGADQIAELAACMGYTTPDELAELGFSLKKLIKKAGKIVHAVAPIVKAVGVVTAFVIPPAGIAITAAAAGADALVKAGEKGGKAAKAAGKIVKATKLLASKGDEGAQAGLAVLNRVATQRRKDNVPRGESHPKLASVKVEPAKLLKHVEVKPTTERGFFVTLDGRVQRRGI
jgi:hypothetical protein